MCGFAIIANRAACAGSGQAIRRMLAAMAHRGPDGEGASGLSLDERWQLWLGHVRLAILDPTSAGGQPMQSASGDTWIVFNGEIYNHRALRQYCPGVRWRSGTDTETLVEMWERLGPQCVNMLDGMFAMCVVQPHLKTAWLVRDRLGIKPAYYGIGFDGALVAASELRAVAASRLLDTAIRRERVAEYLETGRIASPGTLVNGISSVRPGELLKCYFGGEGVEISSASYWPCPYRIDQPRPTDAQSIQRVQDAFYSSMRSHMLSDVKVGVFLSGGLDSGAIVEGVTSSHSNIATYCVSFGEDSSVEESYAADTARAFGTSHSVLRITPRDVLAHVDDVFASYDTPSFDGINTWLICKMVRAAGIKVALSGVGGDELFCGYGYHRWATRLCRAQRAASALSAPLRGITPFLGVRGRKLSEAVMASSWRARYKALRRVMTADTVADLMGERGRTDERRAEEACWEVCEDELRAMDAADAFTVCDMRGYMLGTLLTDTDQMSMRHGVEVRVPFLDHGLVEAVAAVPGSRKMAGASSRSSKPLLRGILRRPLPLSVQRKRKTGFVLPWDRWLRVELASTVSDTLLDGAASRLLGLRLSAIENMVASFFKGKRNVRSTDVLLLMALFRWAVRWEREREPGTAAAV